MGAAVAVALGAGGVATTTALVGTGERAIYQPIEPCRLLDTRPGFEPNQRTAPIGSGEYYDIDVTAPVGQCGDLFDGATALALNVTAINHTADTYLTLFPEDQAPNSSTPPPNVSHLNPSTATGSGVPVPNAVQVDLDDDGEFTVYNRFGSVDVIIDAVGFFEDHHHDDRYYTQGEIDAAIENVYDDAVQAGRFFSIDPLTLPTTLGASTTAYSLRFPDSNTPATRLTFTMPMDLTPGAEVLVRLVWKTYTTNCDVRFNLSEILRTRPGAEDEGSATVHPFVVPAGSDPLISHEAVFPIPPPPGGFLAGDAVNLSLMRFTSDGSGDTCTSVVDVTGIAIIYG